MISRHPKATCLSGKRPYGSRGAAREAARAVRARRGRWPGRKVELDAYRCAACGAWHLTSKS